MKRVHPDGVTGRLHVLPAAAAGGLEHLQLRLELGSVTAVGVERFLDALGVEAVADLRDVLQPR